jgi:hypothetical protein
VVDPAWPAGGKALSITNRQQSGAQIVADGLGGAVVAWQDSFVVVAQHVLANGALDPAYPDTGRQVSDVASDAGDIALVGTDRSGAIVAWTDNRNGKDTDIFAMDVLVANTVGVSVTPALESRLLRPVPNPAHGPLTVRFALRREARVKLDVYDASGRRVRRLVSGLQPAGQHAITWDLREEHGVALPAGLYFARLDVEGHSLTQKLVTLK